MECAGAADGTEKGRVKAKEAKKLAETMFISGGGGKQLKPH